MNDWIWIAGVSFLSALLSAMGMGGGGVLLLYLTAFAGMEQLRAQGMNLLFFLPVGGVALLLHAKKKRVQWRATAGFLLGGFGGVWLGVWAAAHLNANLLQKLFGGFLLVVGLRELWGSGNSGRARPPSGP